MAELYFPPNDTNPLCDFCSDRSQQPVAALLVKTRVFRLDADHGVRHVSEGEWYVCRTCLDLIMAHDVEKLRRRAVDTFIARHYGSMPPSLIDIARHVLQQDIPTIHRQALDQLTDWPTRY